jgi:uncharacterized protein
MMLEMGKLDLAELRRDYDGGCSRRGARADASRSGDEAYPEGMATTVPALVERVLPVLHRYGARRAGVFGSYARGQAGPESDLDLVVELPPGSSLLDLIGLEQDLSDELGLKVEATTYRALHPRLRDRVLQDEIRIL